MYYFWEQFLNLLGLGVDQQGIRIGIVSAIYLGRIYFNNLVKLANTQQVMNQGVPQQRLIIRNNSAV